MEVDMAVFMDTGGGDIYAAETREQCIAAIKADVSEEDFAGIEHELAEVSGSLLMNDSERGQITLDENYRLNGIIDQGYCIATENQ
jgi:hypothetical protein